MTAENYRLILQRQSGTQPLPVQINVGGVTHAATVGEGWLDWALP